MPLSPLQKRNRRKAIRNRSGMRFVKSWRRRRGLTQAKAAALIGVTSITWSRWERGVIPVSSAWRRMLTLLDRQETKPLRRGSNGRAKKA